MKIPRAAAAMCVHSPSFDFIIIMIESFFGALHENYRTPLLKDDALARKFQGKNWETFF